MIGQPRAENNRDLILVSDLSASGRSGYIGNERDTASLGKDSFDTRGEISTNSMSRGVKKHKSNFAPNEISSNHGGGTELTLDSD